MKKGRALPGFFFFAVRTARVNIESSLIAYVNDRGRDRPYVGKVHAAEAFWYENANGRVESAADRERAVDGPGLECGDVIEIVS